MKNSIHRKIPANHLLMFSAILFMVVVMCGMNAYAQQPDKVQSAIDSIKEAYYCEDQDYHTDGQRVVWVKSYKNWIPEDFIVMRKEAPGMLRFLSMVAQRERYDLLSQLLPNYYRARGGAKAFAEDILRNQSSSQNGSVKKKASK